MKACLGATNGGQDKRVFPDRLRISSPTKTRYDVIEAVLGIEYGDLLSTVARADALSALKDNEKYSGFTCLLHPGV